MARKGRKKLLCWIQAILIGAPLPLLFSHQSWAKNCTKTEINSQIEQFSDVKQAKVAVDGVVECGENAIALLELALSGNKAAIRANAAAALGKMGATAQDAAPTLVTVLEDKESIVRTQVASALIQIGRAVQKQEIVSWDVSAVQKLKTFEKHLMNARQQLQADKRDWASKNKDIERLRLVGNALQVKHRRLEAEKPYQIIQWLQANPWSWVAVGGITVYGGILLGIFVLNPIFLLKLDKWFKPASFKIPKINLEVSLSDFLLFLKYHPRVLDCWVAQHLDQAKSLFLQQPTVSDRKIHIPIQIKLGEQLLDNLAPQHLHSAFSQSPVCLLIVGEGGVGKTSLAYQIARWGLMGKKASEGQPLCSHHMLPVAIDKELENTSLLDAIRQQLPQTGENEYIADELLKALLKRQRVLLILDHVSEMSQQTYEQMQEELNKTPINALIITSRLKEKDLGRSRKTQLEPQKIEGARLSNFVQPYLEARGKKDIFEDDAEFYRTCTRLATMMAATLQSTTALLVRMYVDRVIEVGGLKTALLPDDIPTLMLQYLEWLNRGNAIDSAVRQDDAVVLQSAKAVAWICLRDNYYPTEGMYEDVIQALQRLSQAENPQQDAKERLTYLQKTLGLLQVSANRVKIILDPVAEYLAALQVVAVCQQRQGEESWQEFFQNVNIKPEQEATEAWEQFLHTVDAKPDLDQIHGFLLAAYNCCRQEGKKLPQGLLEQLERRAKLDSGELEQVRRRQRINRLIDELYYADEPKYLGQAIRNLQDEGAYAHKAIPDLLKVFNDKEKIAATLRIEALNALMQIQADIEKRDALCREVLSNRGDVPEVRVAAINALLQFGQNSDALKELLNNYFQDETEVGVVRVQAGEGLRKLGVLQELLVVELSEDATPTIHLLPTPETWVVELSKGIELVMVRIPGGTFMMGSPEREGYNRERPQHQVTVPDFWMGQFPVTQAQYEALMGYNPSSFPTNGSNRPVETVSWYKAVDFCQRLSKLTGQEFRLPSEAEWEYACRAGTTTPFSFGETITTDYANYRGTDLNLRGKIYSGAYGQGSKGIFREQTTEVGSFPPNAFGLYDMHGNVWEWCADHWHDNYENASTDSSTWVGQNSDNNRYHVLRGGSWLDYSVHCRSAFRYELNPGNTDNDIGLRVVCSVAP
ncbi:MAG: SUMF1/EgtB/PvdO family nonheme iron enzyme [Cyanobacteria bacterium P01_D01_bin.116]